jgi:hypothetical protein
VLRFRFAPWWRFINLTTPSQNCQPFIEKIFGLAGKLLTVMALGNNELCIVLLRNDICEFSIGNFNIA